MEETITRNGLVAALFGTLVTLAVGPSVAFANPDEGTPSRSATRHPGELRLYYAPFEYSLHVPLDVDNFEESAFCVCSVSRTSQVGGALRGVLDSAKPDSEGFDAHDTRLKVLGLNTTPVAVDSRGGVLDSLVDHPCRLSPADLQYLKQIILEIRSTSLCSCVPDGLFPGRP